MRTILITVAVIAIAAATPAQTIDFDIQVGGPCGVTFPSPQGAGGDPEGISHNAQGIATVDIMNGCGLPASGAQYLRVTAETISGVGEVYGGGVMPTTLLATTNQVFLPVPPGGGTVSLLWDFYNAEGPSSTFNDGMMIDFIDAANNQLAVVAFADTFTAAGTCFDGGSACGAFGYPEVDPGAIGPGAEVVNGFAVPAGAMWLRVSIWNGTDSVAESTGAVDVVTYQGAVPTTYPGTGEDLVTTIAINGASPSVVAGGNDIHVVAPGDFVEVGHSSPGGTFVGIGDFAAVGSFVLTPNPLPQPFPGIWLDVTSVFAVIAGTVGGFPILLPAAGTSYSFVNSGGLAGLSFGLQGFVITATAGNSIFASTNALELQLN